MEQMNVVDITTENFQQVIIEGSQDKVVMVGFWSARDQGCMDLMETLASVAAGYPDDLLFAKIDCDSQPQVAMQFGIQSLPTVALLKEARPLDSFVGIKTAEEVEAFLAPHLPKPEDGLLAQSRELLTAGDAVAAFAPAKQAFELNAERADIKMAYAEACIHTGKLEQAEQVLQSIGMIDQDSDFQALLSALELAQNAADSPQIQALQGQLAAEPDNHDIKVQLAVQLSQANRHEEALTHLFEVLRTDMNFGDAKKTYLDILATLPDGDPLAPVWRRKIYSLMY